MNTSQRGLCLDALIDQRHSPVLDLLQRHPFPNGKLRTAERVESAAHDRRLGLFVELVGPDAQIPVLLLTLPQTIDAASSSFDAVSDN